MTVHNHHGGKDGSRQAGMVLEQKLRAHISINKQQTERANWNWCGLVRHQILPPMAHLLQQGHIPNAFQRVPPTGDQLFEYMSLWGVHPHSDLMESQNFFVFPIFNVTQLP